MLGFDCGRWDNLQAPEASWGLAGSIPAWTESCDALGRDPGGTCSSLAALYCFEQ